MLECGGVVGQVLSGMCNPVLLQFAISIYISYAISTNISADISIDISHNCEVLCTLQARADKGLR